MERWPVKKHVVEVRLDAVGCCVVVHSGTVLVQPGCEGQIAAKLQELLPEVVCRVAATGDMAAAVTVEVEL